MAWRPVKAWAFRVKHLALNLVMLPADAGTLPSMLPQSAVADGEFLASLQRWMCLSTVLDEVSTSLGESPLYPLSSLCVWRRSCGWRIASPRSGARPRSGHGCIDAADGTVKGINASAHGGPPRGGAVLNDFLTLLLQAIGVILAADFASGIIHWIEDAYVREHTPVIGRWMRACQHPASSLASAHDAQQLVAERFGSHSGHGLAAAGRGSSWVAQLALVALRHRRG